MGSIIATCSSNIAVNPVWAGELQRLHTAFQDDSLFQLGATKSQRLQTLKKRFDGTTVRKLFLGAHLGGIGLQLPGVAIDVLPQNFFLPQDANSKVEKINRLENGIVLLNNNDLGQDDNYAGFAEVMEDCAGTIFLVWDFDNHHWLDLSKRIAIFSDMYFPTHNENIYFLSRLNWNIAGPVPCGTIQWTREYLTQALPTMLQKQRSDEPLGMHFYYPQFPFRNRSVYTLRQHYASIDFSNAQFHGRSLDDRLQEWCAHKSHWVIPVLNDVPIRIFDALSTGGIPIAPSSLRYLWPVSQIPQEWIIFYEPEELLSPERVVLRANAAFDSGGAQGIVGRHRFALQNHHGENSLRTILGYSSNRFGFKLGASCIS